MTSAVASRFRAEGATDVGRVRTNNEDWWAKGTVHTAAGTYHLWVVADGMGGGAKGEVASQLAVERLVSFVAEGGWADPATALRDGFQLANAAVFDRGTGGGEAPRSIMGTTLVAALVAENSGQFWVANVGDSRAYLLGAGGLRQLTQDHSLVAERVRMGELTPEDARTADDRNVITRAIGLEPFVTADVFELGVLGPGERVLLCSDGVHGMLTDEQIAAGLATPPLETAVGRLIEEANAAGGHDNATALVGGCAGELGVPWDVTVVEVRAPQPQTVTTRRQIVAGALACAAIVAVAFVAWLSGTGDGESSTTPVGRSPRPSIAAVETVVATATLAISPASSVISQQTATGGRTYKVQTGDTCLAIAKRKRIAVESLQDLNPGVCGETLQQDTVLQLPRGNADGGP